MKILRNFKKVIVIVMAVQNWPAGPFGVVWHVYANYFYNDKQIDVENATSRNYR